MGDLVHERLANEWDLDSGFLGQLRVGVFDKAAYQRLLDSLSGIEASAFLDRELVRVIWYIPVFMEWNKDSVISSSTADCLTYERACNALLGEVERILGIP